MKNNIIKTDSMNIVLDLMQSCEVQVSVRWSWRYLKFMYHIEFVSL